MGDQIYLGVYLSGISPKLSASAIAVKIENYISAFGLGHAIVPGGPFVTLFDTGAVSNNAVIRGLDLPYDVIRDALKARMLGPWTLNMSDVDFGISRNSNGLMLQYPDEALHKRLREGQGIRHAPGRLFSDEFYERVLGGYSDAGHRLVATEDKKDLQLCMLNRISGFLSYGNNHTTVSRVPGTIIEFTSRLETLQGLLYLNGNREFCKKGVMFQTNGPTASVPGSGLGAGRKLEDFKSIVARFGYVPFEALDQQMLRPDLPRGAKCIFCTVRYEIVGLGSDLQWLAVKCRCRPDRVAHSWPREGFFRLVLNCPTGSGEDGKKQKESLALFIKGLTPFPRSIEHFRRSVYAAMSVEVTVRESELSTRFQEGVIHSEMLELDTRTRTLRDGQQLIDRLVNLELATPLSSTWGPDGSRSISRVVLIPQRMVASPRPSLSDLYLQMDHSVNGKLRRISAVANLAVVELTVWIPPSFSTVVGKKFYLLPVGRRSDLDALEIAIGEWSHFRGCREKLTIPQAATVTAIKKLELGSVPGLLTDGISWELELKTRENSMLGGFRRLTSPSVNFGVQLLESVGGGIGSPSLRLPITGVVTDITPNKDSVVVSCRVNSGDAGLILPHSSYMVTFWIVSYDEELRDNLPMFSPESQSSGNVDYSQLIISCPFTNRVDLRDFLLDPSQPRVEHVQNGSIVNTPFDYRRLLNSSQTMAVDGFLKDRLHITEGPPGCGKTVTACNGIVALSAGSPKDGLIICVTPTNVAADVLLSALYRTMEATNYNMSVRRLLTPSREGQVVPEHPERYVHTSIERHSAYRGNREAFELIARQARSERVVLSDEEEKVVLAHVSRVRSLVLAETDVLICTISTASDKDVVSVLENHKRLDAIIMDESNCIKVSSILPLLSLGPSKVWMLGDCHQLRPCVKTMTAAMACEDVSWMEMISTTEHLRPHVTRLDEQYRFPTDISNLVSEWSYEGRLRTGAPKRETTRFGEEFFVEFPQLVKSSILRIAYRESGTGERLSGNRSYQNDRELGIIAQLLEKLVRGGVAQKEIVILPLYAAQLQLISSHIMEQYPEVTVCTADAFEGRESSVVIVSMTRCNQSNEIGFIRFANRVNVAISRPRDYLFYISSEDTFIGSECPQMRELYRLMDKNGIEPTYM